MSAETTSGERDLINISFTALLYGVVIGVALDRFEDLTVSPVNILLIFSLFLIVQDFFFYHEDMKKINLSLKKRQAEDGRKTDGPDKAERVAAERKRRKNEWKIFLFDLILLAVWYGLCLAARSPLPRYLLWLSAFFLTVSLWNWAAPSVAPPENVKQNVSVFGPVAVLGVTLACAVLALLQLGYYFGSPDEYKDFNHWTARHWVFFLIPVASVLSWRVLYWEEFRRRLNADTEKFIDLISPPPPPDPRETIQTLVDGFAESVMKAAGDLDKFPTTLAEVRAEMGSLLTTKQVVEMRGQLTTLTVREEVEKFRREFDRRFKEVEGGAGGLPDRLKELTEKLDALNREVDKLKQGAGGNSDPGAGSG
ncbi:MAG TPA: hypothetical protein VGV38_06860 [Pyrinomonadaceae bacterium]|nr:hypothetical protein [Pyrinomonadaceae bacterium]